MLSVDKLVLLVEKDLLLKEVERLQGIVDACVVSDEAPCYYCGAPVEPLSGHPSLWPLYFPQPNEPGICKAHHVGCVVERLAIVDAVKKYTELKAKAEELTSEQWAAAEAKWQEIVQQAT